MSHLIDTHCHLNFNRYDEDRDDVLQRAADTGVVGIIIPGIDLQTSREAADLATKHKSIYAAVGIHPNSTANFLPAHLGEIEALTHRPKVIAIGEIGLDYYWDKSPPDQQKRAFEIQLELAAGLELPIIVHNRDASEDTMDILESWVSTLPDSLRNRPGVMHSFSGSAEIAERALQAGFYLGFTGPITFKKAEETRRIAASTPLDRILIETDGPFLTPVPHRGKRNEPAYVAFVAERLAKIHKVSTEEMARITNENARSLFALPDFENR